MHVTRGVNVKKTCDNEKKTNSLWLQLCNSVRSQLPAQLMLNRAKTFQSLMDCKLAFNKRDIIEAREKDHSRKWIQRGSTFFPL